MEQDHFPAPASLRIPGPINHHIVLWSLRVLVRMCFFKRFAEGMSGFHNEELLQSIGLHEFYQRDHVDEKVLFAAIGKYLNTLEAKGVSSANDTFSNNIVLLKESLTLTDTEVEILRFVVIVSTAHGFGMILDMLGEMTNEQMKKALSTILNVPLAEIERALSAGGALMSSGMLRLETGGGYLLPLRVRLDIPDGLKYALSQEHNDKSSVLQCFFRKSTEARLTIDDFHHIRPDARLLENYLMSSTGQGTQGVNILLYGEPGTGKTELVRALADACGLELYEITMQGMDGEPIDGRDRLSAFQLSQKLLAREKRCLIMFDEIEDAFPNTGHMFFGSPQTMAYRKAWVNNLLEKNPIPAFWVTNSAHHIEPSFLRRFDYTLRMRPPSRSVRRRILKKYAGHLPVRDAWFDRMAEHQHLAPAHIERAAKVATHLKQCSAEEIESTLDRIIGNTLEVMGLPRKPRAQANQVTGYSLDFLNPDHDVRTLTDGLRQYPKGRLCLYGAPGTGKSAFAHYIAQQLDKPLLIRRASDMLSKWVGETEGNIAAMFEEAEVEDMIVLLDEADSFLQERSGAHASWEVTQVNELLVQMENFDGVFIASTNLIDHLDAASLRRFDLKIKFDYLKYEQVWGLFMQILKEHGSGHTANEQSVRQALAQLDNLTPGDFAVAVRKAKSFNRVIDAGFLLESLSKEHKAKPGNRKPIGFMQVKTTFGE